MGGNTVIGVGFFVTSNHDDIFIWVSMLSEDKLK